MPKNNSSSSTFSQLIKRHLTEAIFILLAALAIFLLLALVTYHSSDPGWSNTGAGVSVRNAAGRLGAWFSDLILYFLGYSAYLLPIGLAYLGWLAFRYRAEVDQELHKSYRFLMGLRVAGLFLFLASLATLLAMHISGSLNYLPFRAGGILGEVIAKGLLTALGGVGANLIVLALILVSFTLATGLSWLTIMDYTGHYSILFYEWIKKHYLAWRAQRAALAELKPSVEVPPAEKPRFVTVEKNDEKIHEKMDPLFAPKASERAKPLISEPLKTPIKPSARAQEERQVNLFESVECNSLPPLSLLEKAKENKEPAFSKEMLEKLSHLIEEKLKEFGIEAHVVAVYPGPVITRFELDLAAGTKASRLTSLSRDLARSLSVVSVRIVEVIPGKTYVGFEIPNEHREIIRLSEVLESQEYDASKSALSLMLGKDIAGRPFIVDLAKMPHLLVAGTTGSGKSVGINAMLLSLLYKSTPENVRMILIDPKMLELSVYDKIPHLLTPVITDMKDASNALRWCIGEMDRRYRVMAALGVRNLAGYNTKIIDAKKAKQPIMDPLWPAELATPAPELEKLPFIVVVVDEFADMMMVVGKKVEELIARLAQKARAAGIHLILATQRPSVDVITGLIKANIPTRIAFQVSSRIDSRTILDQQGAEQLLGQGDMLYMSAGQEPVRVHGAYVSDQEVHSVAQDLKKRGDPHYVEEILDDHKNVSETGLPISDQDSENLDPLFDEAVQVVAETRRASISSVQRRLKIGYNRAARILEQMEAQGMVSAMETNGLREVLLPPVQEK